MGKPYVGYRDETRAFSGWMERKQQIESMEGRALKLGDKDDGRFLQGRRTCRGCGAPALSNLCTYCGGKT